MRVTVTRQALSSACYRAGTALSRSAVDGVFQRFAGLEARHVGRSDANRLAGARVASLAPRAVRDGERAEANQ